MGVALGVARNSFSLAPSGQEYIIEYDEANQTGGSSTFVDSSGSGLDLSLYSTSVNSGSIKYFTTDGSADYGQVDVGTAFDALSEFTIECVYISIAVNHAYPRFNFNQSSEFGFRLVTTQSTTGWNAWVFNFNGTNYSLDDNSQSSSNSAYSYTANEKQYCAATYDGTTLKSYFGQGSSVSNVSTTTVAESDRGVLNASYKSDKNLVFGRETNYSPTRYQASRFYYWSIKSKCLSSSEIDDRWDYFEGRFNL